MTIAFLRSKDKSIVQKALTKCKSKAKIVTSDVSGGILLADKGGKKIRETIDSAIAQKRDEIRSAIVKKLEN